MYSVLSISASVHAGWHIFLDLCTKLFFCTLGVIPKYKSEYSSRFIRFINLVEWFRMVLLIMEYGFKFLVLEEKKSKSIIHKSGFAPRLSSNSWFLIFRFLEKCYCSILPRSGLSAPWSYLLTKNDKTADCRVNSDEGGNLLGQNHLGSSLWLRFICWSKSLNASIIFDWKVWTFCISYLWKIVKFAQEADIVRMR